MTKILGYVKAAAAKSAVAGPGPGVRLATVFGDPLPIDDAAELLDGLSARAVAEAADEAIEAVLLSSEHGALLFRHGLVRESVYADLPERSRQFIHLTCARHQRDVGCDALTVAAQARAAFKPGDETVALLLADAAADAVTALPKTAAGLILPADSADDRGGGGGFGRLAAAVRRAPPHIHGLPG
jgi:hypothetical protein